MNKLRTPAGVGDIYGKDCLLKAHTTDSIREVCQQFGYGEIQTPAFEYLEVFGDDMSIPSDESIKFIDTSGKVLVLRPDFTTSISRAVASHLSDKPLPLRLWYSGNVYRSGETYKSAKKKEFAQSGVELIGANTPNADAEVIALTITALLRAGLEDFQLELSHSDFLQGIIEDCKLSEDDADTLRSLLDKKFSIGIEEFCDNHAITGTNREILSEISLFFGDCEEVLAKYTHAPLNEKSAAAIADLNSVYNILKAFKMEKYITVDLGQVRSFRYYTGVIFRALTTASAFPICGGGRYNTLGRRFDLDLPATGVAFWIDRISDAICRMENKLDLKTEADAIIFSKEENLSEAYHLASSLRSKGKKVILDVCNLSKEEAQHSAEIRNIRNVYFV
ncbi:MAG: ATP phosphoribosyltransferase regulatory subunit [Clostridia bacterium]|nr:ATP phosphoribosyltransferase regulatory subunit [Clostridia bacterium]